MNKNLILLAVSIILATPLFSQTIEYFDQDWNSCEKQNAAFYRKIKYDKNGKPIGKVRDYWVSGELQFEGNFISINPDTLDGICTWYYKNGQKQHKINYKKGEILTKREWSVLGKEEGVLDDSGFFYSKEYLIREINYHSKILDENLEIDFYTDSLLIRLGVNALHKGYYDIGFSIFSLAHDIAVYLGLDLELSFTYNNLGKLYTAQGQYEKSLSYYEKSKNILERLGLEDELSTTYTSIAGVHETQGDYRKALNYYEVSKSIQERLGLEVSLSTTYNNIGVIYKIQGEYKKALSFFEKSERIQKRLELEEKLSTSYNNLGALYKAKGDYKKAIRYYENAIKIRKELGLEKDLSISYNNLGALYKTIGNQKKALGYYQESKKILERLGLEEQLSAVYNNLGVLYEFQGKYALALSHFERSEKIRKRSDLKIDLANTYNNFGVLYESQGDYKKALSYYQKSEKFLIRLGLDINLSTVYNNIGYLYLLQSQFEKALSYYQKAKSIQERLGLKEKLSTTYNNVGHLYQDLGQYKKAISYFEKAIKILKELDLDVDLSTTYNNIGTLFYYQGDYKRALSYYQESEKILRRLGLDVNLSSVLNNLGIIYHYQKENEKALDSFAEAGRINKRLGLEKNLSFTYSGLGHLYESMGNFEKALSYAQKSKEIQQQLGASLDLATVYENLAFLFFKNATIDSALIYAEKSIVINENLRSDHRANTNRKFFIDKNINVLDIAISCSIKMQRHKDAYTFIEQSKVRGLADLLAEQAIKKTTLPPGITNDLKLVKQQLHAVSLQLSENISNEKRKNLIHFRDSIYQRQTVLEDRVKTLAPEYANIAYPSPIVVQQVQEVLKPDEVLVEYYLGSAQAYAFILTKEDYKTVELVSPDSIRQALLEFKNEYVQKQKDALITNSILMNKKLEKTFPKISSQLFNLIWAPLHLDTITENKKIIIVPDGQLHYLPFELLISNNNQKNYRDYDYLIKEYELSYYPSGGVLHHQRTKTGKRVIPQNLFFAIGVSDFNTNMCYDNSIYFPSLPNSDLEIKSILPFVSKNRSHFLLGKDATEENFKKVNFEDYRFLHFSTHSVVNTENPAFSRILMQPSATEDGCLNLYEFFDLKLNADLITFSACGTGLGKLVKGEGMMGFTRALMYTGSSSIVLSLWDVVDLSTKDIFIDYYSTLLQEVSKDKHLPLRAAQLKMIESGGNFSNPYYWAPFVFIGAR